MRLFIQWIDYYHEAHFAVIRAIFQNPGATRSEMWESVHGQPVREDSAEADLFKLLIRELSMGGVIRQHRETTAGGQFLRKQAVRTPKGYAPRTMKSAFDDGEQCELTELGKQFVHYTMNEVVQRIGDEAGNWHPSSTAISVSRSLINSELNRHYSASRYVDYFEFGNMALIAYSVLWYRT